MSLERIEEAIEKVAAKDEGITKKQLAIVSGMTALGTGAGLVIGSRYNKHAVAARKLKKHDVAEKFGKGLAKILTGDFKNVGK